MPNAYTEDIESEINKLDKLGGGDITHVGGKSFSNAREATI